MQQLAKKETSYHVSFHDALQQCEHYSSFTTERERKLLRWFLYKIGLLFLEADSKEVWMSAKLSDVTLIEMAADFGSFGEFEGSHCLVKEGLTNSLIEGMAAGLDIQLNHQVTKIDTSLEDVIHGKMIQT